MKTTISTSIQLFNVNDIAANNLGYDAIPKDKLAFIDISTGKTKLPTSKATLPDVFDLVLKHSSGRVLRSLDHIHKSRIYDVKKDEYTEAKVNKWTSNIKNVDCSEVVHMSILIDEDSLNRRDGLTWSHIDNHFLVDPSEMDSYVVDCSDNGHHTDNTVSYLLYKKIKATNSPFYTAELFKEETTGSGSTASTTDTALADSDAEKYIEDNKDDEKKRVFFVLVGKEIPVSKYHDIEVNYLYPRGVGLHPAIVNGNRKLKIEESQAIEYETGSGYDLRDEEFNCMNAYTNLNYYPQLSDGISNSKDLFYQFDSSKTYDTVTFRYTADKTPMNEITGDKDFVIILGSEKDNGQFTRLDSIFS